MGRDRKMRKAALILAVFSLFFKTGFGSANTLAWEKNPTARVDLAEENVFNANKTGHSGIDGYEGYLRNVSGQRVHTGFSLNTNSCASCHMTHTGQGETLLFQRSVYNTCTSCHFDAAMNTYNILTDKKLPGGRLYDGEYVSGERKGASFHLATGLKKIADAPGADTSRPGMWDQEVTCGSCHAPHGSYDSRHLNLNPNGQAKRFVNVPLTLVDAEKERYRPSVHADKLPWLYYDAGTASFAAHGLLIKDSGGDTVTGDFFVHYRDGYVEKQGGSHSGPYTITFSQAFRTDFDVVKKNGQEDTVYRSGTVEFCTACHTGYLGRNSEGKTVTNHANFSHVVNEDLTAGYIVPGVIAPGEKLKLEKSRDSEEKRLVCLTCHFAHGTDAELMTDRNFTPVDPQEAEIPAQTQLLRFGWSQDGWEGCFTCHTGGAPSGETQAPEQQEGETAAEPEAPATEQEPAAPRAEPPAGDPVLEENPSEPLPRKEDEVSLLPESEG